MARAALLLVCSFSRAFQMFQEAAREHGFAPLACFTLQEAEVVIGECADLAAIIISEQVLDGSYHRLLRMLADAHKTVPTFVLLHDCGPERQAEAHGLGATACLPRPSTPAEVHSLLYTVEEYVRR